MSTVLGGIPFSDAGALQVQLRPDTGVPSSEPVNGGWAIASALNAAYFEMAGTAVPASAVEIGGIAFTQDGAIYLTQSTTGTFADIGGHKVRSDGALLVVQGTPTVTDPVIGGWAHLASTRAAYVGGDGLSFALPLRDSGAGAVDLTLAIGTGAATFTRATAAASKLSTGLWKLDVASGVARSSYIGLTTAVGAYGGYLAEGARTNSAIQCRDITNAAWTKTTLTTAKTSTGIDGVTNSCTRCTAAGADSLALQAVTLASAAKTFSVWIKRVTGTGNIFITLDNDATRTDVTALINSVTFTLVQMTQTLANPTVGFKIATSTDAIDVDVAQLEDTASFASTPIPTTTIAVTRNADVLTYPGSGNLDPAAGSAYAEISVLNVNPSGTFVAIGGTGNTAPLNFVSTSTNIAMLDSTTTVTKSSLTDMATGVRKRASAWGGVVMAVTGDGAAVAGGAFDGSMSATSIGIGTNGGGSQQLFGCVKNARIWLRQFPDAMLQAITA